MVTTTADDFSPLDHLPYIDTEISPQERERVETLIRSNIQTTDQPHPAVGRILPLASNLEGNSSASLLMNDVERFEAEYHSEDEYPQTIIGNPISLNRYTEFEHDGGTDFDAMYTALSYSILRERNSKNALDNLKESAEPEQMHHANLMDIKAELENACARKRQHIDDVEDARKKRQLDFQSVNDYLSQEWRDGITSMVDAGLEKRLG